MRVMRMLKTPDHIVWLTELTRVGEAMHDGPRWATETLLVGIAGRLYGFQGRGLDDRPIGTPHDLRSPFVTRTQSGEDRSVVCCSSAPLKTLCFWPRDEGFLSTVNPSLLNPRAVQSILGGEPWEVRPPMVQPVPVLNLNTLEPDPARLEQVHIEKSEPYRLLF